MDYIPGFRPEMPLLQAFALIQNRTIPNCLLGIRGFFNEYYKTDSNERGVYDDAIFLVTDKICLGFNANCDATKYVDDTAELNPGLWSYKTGIHGLKKTPDKQYMALVQNRPVTVTRANGITETGFFGINIHRGGQYSTGSLGCQTIYPGQWEEFIETTKSAIRLNMQPIIPYLLMDLPKSEAA